LKDKIAGLVIFFVLVGLFSFNSHMVEMAAENITEELVKAEREATEDFDARYEFETARKKWNKQRKNLFFVCSHNLITHIDECIELGCEYISVGNRERAVYFFKMARLALEDLSHREKIRLDNIF